MENIAIAAEFTTNIPGRVKNLDLPKSKALWPLFEVVTNSIHAIEEKGNIKNGNISIEIIREGHDEALIELSEVNQYTIKSFIVTDNGIGFNDLIINLFLQPNQITKLKRARKASADLFV